MAGRKLFYEDPSLVRAETTVVESGATDGRPWVRLAETPFFPEGGGQPADRGTIGGIRVLDVQWRGSEVLHYVAEPLPLGAVAAEIDGARRFDVRQQHTAQHLLTAILADRYGLPTTSFHLGERYTAIEVDGPPASASILAEVEEIANAILLEDRAVFARWVEPGDLDSLSVRTRGLPEWHSGPVRLVEISGIDRNTCGGTHVERLGQIQILHILDAQPARGGTRIRFLAGGRVRAEIARHEATEESVRSRLGTGPAEFAAVLDGWQADRRSAERRIRDLEKRLAEALAGEIAALPGETLARFVPEATPEFLRVLASTVLERRRGAVVALVGGSERGEDACFLVQAGSEGPGDVSGVGEALRAALGARGGGKGRLFQGRGGRWSPDAFLSIP